VTRDLPPARRTLVIAANSAWNIANFRAPLIEALVEAGWEVVALAPDDGSIAVDSLRGTRFEAVSIDSSGTSVLRDGRLFMDYVRILRRLQPAAFLGFTVKPNVYGSLAAHMLGIKVINNVSGLGTAFMRPGLLNWVVRRLYHLALRRSARVFFQNPDDRDLFLAQSLVRARQAGLLPGSGVDLQKFRPIGKPRAANAPFRFLFVGRLLRDKGLAEYAEAACLLRPSWPSVEFAMLGFADSDNRSAVPMAEVRRWQADNLVNYLGETDDVRPFLADCDCVVLPSYREGLPRSLLEASAMGKPMVATDVPGCRDLVLDGENGLLCEARSATSLASAMESMLKLPPARRAAMGRKARTIVEQRFDQSLVTQAYLEALR
jgi:glycosyltransferase involved in cell wall biosynthesis